MAIACTEPVAELVDSTNSTSYSFAAFTPTADAVLVVFTAATDCVATGTMSGGGLSWHHKVSQRYGAASEHVCSLYWALTGSAPGSTTIMWSSAFDPATGMNAVCWQWTGADVSGSDPIRQYINATGSGTSPTVTFSLPVLTANGYGIAFGTNVNPPTGTPPITWTEIADTGYGTPTAGMAAAFRATGETGTNYSYSTAAAPTDEWGCIAYEIEAPFDSFLFRPPLIIRGGQPRPGMRSAFKTAALEPADWTTFDPAKAPMVHSKPVRFPQARANGSRVSSEVIQPPRTPAEEVWGFRTRDARLHRPRPGSSRVYFLPEMQGPHLSGVLMNRPRQPVWRGKTRIVGVEQEPVFPYVSRWLVVKAGAPKPKPISQSWIANITQIRPDIAPQVVMSAPRLPKTRGSSRLAYVPDFLSARLQLVPAVYGKPRQAPVRPGRTVVPLVLDPLVEPGTLLPRLTVGKSFAWLLQRHLPQTRVIWCPQDIPTYVRKDDRDNVGANTRGQTSTGGSGRNRSSTGVATQG